jgi:hypothetical protein
MSLIPSNTWRDDPTGATYGPGVSRAANAAAARPYRLRIAPARGAALIVTLHAETSRLAITYAQNRWPGAKVQLLH